METSPPHPAAGRFRWFSESSHVGWVLTAVTCLVLAAGVSMIRQVASVDRLDPVESDDADGDAIAQPERPSVSNKLVLRPEESAPPSGVTPAPMIDLDGDRY